MVVVVGIWSLFGDGRLLRFDSTYCKQISCQTHLIPFRVSKRFFLNSLKDYLNLWKKLSNQSIASTLFSFNIFLYFFCFGNHTYNGKKMNLTCKSHFFVSYFRAFIFLRKLNFFTTENWQLI